MAKKSNFDPSFNFGANAVAKPKKSSGKKAKAGSGGGFSWAAYTGGKKKR